jgi:hypothetical protein
MSTFPNHYPWNRPGTTAPQDNRPYAEVVIHYNGKKERVWCLVDSGADKLQVDISFGNALGVPMNAPVTVTMADGSTTSMNMVAGISIEVEGQTSKSDCYFGSNNVNLLGRVTFLNTFAELGFDINGWMHT